jgi:molybdopterin synthase sulfur carrier subunit
MPDIRIPVPLRKVTNNLEVVKIEGTSISEVLMMLCSRYPELYDRIFDADSNVRRFINIFLNDEDIKFLKDLDTEVKESDEISIVPAIAGG